MDHDAPQSPESTLIGGAIQQHQDHCALADPRTYAGADDPPFLIIHGDADPLVPHGQSVLLHETLSAKGVESELFIVPGGGHGAGVHVPAYTARMVEFFSAARKAKLGAAGR